MPQFLMLLRDARFTGIKASLHNGPIHFNHYPDLTLSLDDEWIIKALTSTLKLPDTKC